MRFQSFVFFSVRQRVRAKRILIELFSAAYLHHRIAATMMVNKLIQTYSYIRGLGCVGRRPMSMSIDWEFEFIKFTKPKTFTNVYEF